MDSAKLQRLEHRARRAYEWSRARRAAIGFAPVSILVGGAVVLGEHPTGALAFGAALFLLGVLMLWHGRELKRSVLPGLVAGLIPLVAVLCVHRFEPCCTGAHCAHCMAMCLPACAAGGLGAGLVVAAVGLRHRRGLWFWLAASGIALSTGAMGCICVGMAGLGGLGLGYAFGFAPGLVATLLRRHRPG
jgi:hypothetical protein